MDAVELEEMEADAEDDKGGKDEAEETEAEVGQEGEEDLWSSVVSLSMLFVTSQL